MKFEQVCLPMHDYFAQHALFRILLPISMPLMLLCVLLRLINQFISLGSAVSTLSFLGFLFFAVLVASTCNFRMVAIGMGAFAAQDLLSLIIYVVRRHSISYGTLIYVFVFGFLAFKAYRKSIA